MTAENNHPKIELLIVDHDTSDEEYQTIQVRVNGEYKTELTGFVGKENAISIVRAFNCHDELVEALKDTLLVVKGMKNEKSELFNHGYIEQALAKAGAL